MQHTNYHTHSYFCDGKGKPIDYVREAEKREFLALGFSSHAPLPYKNNWTLKEKDFDKYRQTILELKQNAERLDIYLGLEIDYLPPHMTPYDQRFQPLDFTIGSVHIAEDMATHTFYEIDGDEKQYKAAMAFFGGIQTFVEWYYNQIALMCKETPPTIVGHFDLIKKNNTGNKYFSGDEPWYKKAVEKALDAVADSGCILEVNTGGLARKKTTEAYPADWILKECKQREIPITLCSDAHEPSQIDFGLDAALESVKKAGYTELYALLGGEWRPRSI